MAAKGKNGPDADKYKKMFKADKNGNAFLELQSFYKKHDIPNVESFTHRYGADGDGRITFEEYCKGLDRMLRDYNEEMEGLFKEVDTNGDGLLDREELKKVLQKRGKYLSDKKISAILEKMDFDGDNKIKFEEFLDAFESVCD